MTRPMLALLCLTLLACPVVGQEIIKQWEFNTDGDTEGWLPAHSLAPFVVAGGTLKTRVIGPDPYMHDSAGQAFEITCNDSQYIEVRMRHDDGEGAEFFWADTTEGADAGFVAGKERGFSTEPDGEWHVYHVYPLWSGKVTRLRLDPPGEDGAEVEIDYLRIIQGPISSHDPNSPAWDFGGNNGGWIAVTGGSHLAQTPEGARTTLAAESVNLTGPAVDLQAADYKYAMVHLVAGGPLTAMLYWSATDDGNFPGCNQIIFDVPAGISTLNLRLTDNPMYDGEIKRLRLSLEGDAGTEVTLKQLALVATPQGPASLKVVSFAPTAALAAVGRPAGIVAKVENLGGEPVEGAELSVAVEGDVAALAGPARQTVDGLAPGNVREVTWAVDPLGPGAVALALNVNGGRAATSTLRISEPFETPGPQEKPAAAVERNIAWIGSDKVLLTVVRAGQQFSTALLSAVEDGKTRQMAALPYLAALATPNTEGYVPLTASYARAEDKDGTASLKLGGSAMVDEANVTWSVTYSLAPGKQYIEAAYDLGVDRDLRITGFRGPWLWAGEGAFGASQDLGLFPGSEYLVSGERSSSTLDIAPPKHIRFAPHPNTVTVPSMAIEKDGAIVGLMWDPLQRWDREHQKPSAVFASPNFVEGYENHLLGLYLPSIPDWVKANELQAETPYELKSSGRLSLSCCLFAAAKAAVLDSMDYYFDRYGVPPLPPKPRSYEETIAMSMRAYEDVLWVEKARGWMGVIGWAPGASQSVALSYLLAARRTQDEALARKLTEKALAIANPSDLAWSLHRFGEPCRALESAFAQGRTQARRAPEDGKYTFQPDEKQSSLGSPGATAVGICARQVRPLLQNARLTGDQAPLDAALKTLKYMETFKVPRASQVWEVPLHTPDILASGDACDVYLTAFELTGDPELLKRAVYWAKTGVPFVYMWQAPEQRPLMLGSSIAVFGATFYTGSWFARPVQWNGLSYANALQRLADYDDSMPWKHFAEMITISGMNQQSVREEDYGTYTDNWDVIDDVECTVCMLSPGGILSTVFSLTGVPDGYRTEVVRAGESRVCITAAPLISEVGFKDNILQFSLRYDAGQTAYAAIMPIAEPVQVEVGSAELVKRAELSEDAEGWSYDPALKCLTLKLRFAADARRVRVIGAGPATPELPAPKWEFDRPGDTEGWEAQHDVNPLRVEDGRLIVEASGEDPYVASPSIMADAESLGGLQMRARATAPGGQVFFSTDAGGFAPERSASLHLPADGQFHIIEIDLSGNEHWKGLITRVRIDTAGPPCVVEIDWIRPLKE